MSSYLVQSSVSAVHRIKRSGPEMDSQGTPELIMRGLGKASLSFISYMLFSIYDLKKEQNNILTNIELYVAAMFKRPGIN